MLSSLSIKTHTNEFLKYTIFSFTVYYAIVDFYR